MASQANSDDTAEIGVGDYVVMTMQYDRRFTNQRPYEQTGVVTNVTATKDGILYTVRSTRYDSSRKCDSNHVKKL